MAATPGRGRRAARRLAPLALEAWRRWQSLPHEEKERYRALARRYAERGRDAGRMAYKRVGRGGRGEGHTPRRSPPPP
jgi:hypothetical protein